MTRYFYVYILECADGTHYTGITNDLERRFKEHDEGISRRAYTYPRRPVKLAWYELFQQPETAIAFEKKIKKSSQAKKKALIAGEWDQLPELSMNARKRS